MHMRSFLLTLVLSAVSISGWANTTKLPEKQDPPIVDIRLDDVEATLEESAPYGDPNAKTADSMSRPEKYKRQRQRLERQTEDQVVEQIEIQRMQDEKVRQQQLMSDGFTPLSPETTISAPEYKPSRSEIDSSDKTFYLGVGGGLLNYPQAENIVDNGATSIMGGMFLPWNLIGEASFTYSYNEAEIAGASVTEDMDLYQVSGALKYFMEFSWFVPSAGLVLAYSRRVYDGGDNGSNALDAGVSVAGDVRITKNIYLGAEYRYMTNIDYEREQAANRSAIRIQNIFTNAEISNPEAIDYHMLLLNAKYVF